MRIWGLSAAIRTKLQYGKLRTFKNLRMSTDSRVLIDCQGRKCWSTIRRVAVTCFWRYIVHTSFWVLFVLTKFLGRDDGLFRAAIAESGGPAVNFFYSAGPGFNATSPQVAYDTLLNSTGCDDLNCLRALPFDTLNNALNISVNGLQPFGPGES